MENKNTGLIVLITILLVLLLGLSGFIIYDKLVNNDVKTEEKEDNNQDDTQDNNVTSPSNSDNENILSDVYNLPNTYDSTVIEKIVLNRNFVEGNKILYNDNSINIISDCIPTEDDNKLECTLKYNNIDLYKLDYYKIVDSETDFYYIYVLEKHIVFVTMNGMTLGYDFLVKDLNGNIIYNSYEVNPSKYNAININSYKNVSFDDPLLIYGNKIYFVIKEYTYNNEDDSYTLGSDTFYYLDLKNDNQEPIKISTIE